MGNGRSAGNVFSQLKQKKIIGDRKEITILEPDKLKKELSFADRFFEIDTRWFPST